MNTVFELGAVAVEGLRARDLGGALHAWWQVVTGRVTPDTRPGGGDDTLARPALIVAIRMARALAREMRPLMAGQGPEAKATLDILDWAIGQLAELCGIAGME